MAREIPKKPIEEFRQVLIEERKLADKINKKRELGEYNQEQISSQALQLLKDFKEIYKKRRKLQRELFPNEFIEDERIGFGGRGQQILEITPDKNYPNPDKYFLKIAQAVELLDKFKDKVK